MSYTNRPKKQLGQHFLRDRTVAGRIVEVVGITHSDHIYEIGAGEGALTAELLDADPCHLTAIELDPVLSRMLRVRFEHEKRFQLIEGDILENDIPLPAEHGKWRIVGNIPYNITTPILFHLLKQRERIKDLTVMVQEEVANRLISRPACKAYGIPSVFFQLYSRIEKRFNVSRKAFFPVPRVDSSVITFTFFETPKIHLEDETFFFKMVKTVFGQRRKMLKNTLKAWLKAEDLSYRTAIDLTRRPEELSVELLAQLSNELVRYRKCQN